MTTALEIAAAFAVGFLIERAGPLYGTKRNLYIELIRLCWRNDWMVEHVDAREIRLKERRVG